MHCILPHADITHAMSRSRICMWLYPWLRCISSYHMGGCGKAVEGFNWDRIVGPSLWFWNVYTKNSAHRNASTHPAIRWKLAKKINLSLPNGFYKLNMCELALIRKRLYIRLLVENAPRLRKQVSVIFSFCIKKSHKKVQLHSLFSFL